MGGVWQCCNRLRAQEHLEQFTFYPSKYKKHRKKHFHDISYTLTNVKEEIETRSLCFRRFEGVLLDNDLY